MIKKRKFVHYSQADMKFTEENYLTMTDKAIGAVLGKRKEDIGTLRTMLTLTKRDKVKPKYQVKAEMVKPPRHRPISDSKGNFKIDAHENWIM